MPRGLGDINRRHAIINDDHISDKHGDLTDEQQFVDDIDINDSNHPINQAVDEYFEQQHELDERHFDDFVRESQQHDDGISQLLTFLRNDNGDGASTVQQGPGSTEEPPADPGAAWAD